MMSDYFAGGQRFRAFMSSSINVDTY